MKVLTFISLVAFSVIAFCSTANALDAPELGTPKGDCNNILPTFSWSKVPDATKYKIYVKNRDTGSLVFKKYTPATSYTPPLTDRLEWGVHYKWWVQAWNETEGLGPKSKARGFTTICDCPNLEGTWECDYEYFHSYLGHGSGTGSIGIDNQDGCVFEYEGWPGMIAGRDFLVGFTGDSSGHTNGLFISPTKFQYMAIYRYHGTTPVSWLLEKGTCEKQPQP